MEMANGWTGEEQRMQALSLIPGQMPEGPDPQTGTPESAEQEREVDLAVEQILLGDFLLPVLPLRSR